MKVIVEKFEGRGAIPPFADGFEGSLAVNLSKLSAITDNEEVITAAYAAVIDLACCWQQAFGHELDREAVRVDLFEKVKDGEKVVLYHSRSGTKYLIKNGFVIARAWESGNGPHSSLEATVRETVEIDDAQSIVDYLLSII